MPLFGRRLFHINENDIKEDNHDIYTIEHTGEEFHSKILYDKLKKIYDLERWTCECTWRAGLTHKEAYQSEIDIRKTLETIVPNYFNKPIFDIIYHNVKPLEKLAEEVSIILSQSFVINEPIQFKKKKDNTIVKGIIERIDDNEDPKKRSSERASVQSKPPSDKQMKNVKYSVRLLDEDCVMNNVLPNELQRCSFIPNREKLKTFIRSYAIRLGNRIDSPWIFYDETNKEKYDIKDRLSTDIIEKFKKSTTVTLDEIVREQERIARKQAEEQAAALAENDKSKEINNNTSISNGHLDDIQIILSDDENKSKISNKKTSPIKKSPTKAKKQLTLHDMKFMKNAPNHNELLEKSSIRTYDIAIPYSLLQKLDKTRRERGIDSRYFHRLILNCARTLNDKQRLRLPDEYRSLIQIKYDELELKRRLSQMNDEEKKLFLQTKRLEQKPIEDFDCTFLKDLPQPKQIETTLNISSNSIGNFLMVSTFLTSCHSLFYLSLNDEISKTTQIYLRSFKIDYLLNTSINMFSNYFIEILQILMKLLFKEDENRSNDSENQDDDDVEKKEEQENTTTTNNNNNNKEKNSKNLNNDNNNNEQIDIEDIYSIQLSDIPLTPYTCQELTRLYLLKEKDETNQNILEKLANSETKDLQISEQIDLLVLLVNTITTDNELMSDYFEYLTRTMSEAARERNQLIAERRKAQEEESKQKKIQLQNGENEKVSSKKQTKIGPLITPKNSNGITNDENQQTSPGIVDENGDIDDGDLKTVLQRRRQMVALSKELKEKREIEAQKLYIKQKRQLAIQKAEQIYQDALVNLQYGFRIKPLGYDRNYNRYWFFRGYPGIFVEKGWIGSDVNYSVELSSEDVLSTTNDEKIIPKDELNQWFIYDDEIIIQQLIQSLNDRGIREHNLLINLKKSMPLIHNEFEQIKKSKNSLEQHDENLELSNDIITSFKSELEDIETRLRLGSLGGFIIPENLVEWQNKLKQSNERIDLGELLIQLQQTVADKYASGIFNLPDKKSFQIWLNDCRTCKTYSRLYVLMMIFENSITWNKSTVGIKCKICRKKHKDEYIIVCDQCCYGFHQECLRDSNDNNIKNSTNDLWYCPACRPSTKRRIRQDKKKIDYQENEIYDDDMDVETDSNTTNQEDLSESDHNIEDDICHICGGENDLIQCTQCQLHYHCQCHEPPLRCAPRSTTWICNNCRNEIANETNKSKTNKQIKKSKQKTSIKTQKQNNTRKNSRKNYCEADEEEESEAEEKTKGQRRSKRLRRSEPSPAKKNEDNQRTNRRSRTIKSISSSSSSSSDEDQITNNNDDDESNLAQTDDDEEENENNNDDSPSSN
ncbi:unnamed protein product [Adineta steineri]|uniref:Uncharacterized protein n=1 Tax=Adineta steineri TaxID=433720 RepID=A0A814N3S7_9BILA|nr:unnamed protein product [Adineta steineri]CAF1143740.1 unnamed protein product [Adineta steineri]